MPNQTGVKNKYEKGIRIKLFFAFFKIGLFTFGGGYAMLPLIHTDIVENRKWMSDEEMTDILAISQSAPGAFAINVSAFVGSRLGGFGGAAAAALGSSLPSFIVILIVSYLFGELRTNPFVDAAFAGVRAGVVVLIINAVIKLAAKLKWKVLYAGLAVAAFALSVFTEISVIYILIGAGIAGLVFSLVNALRAKGDLPK
jgi:chromate transporter